MNMIKHFYIGFVDYIFCHNTILQFLHTLSIIKLYFRGCCFIGVFYIPVDFYNPEIAII